MSGCKERGLTRSAILMTCSESFPSSVVPLQPARQWKWRSGSAKGMAVFRWCLTRCNPVRDENGQITRLYLASTDIEDRKRVEERLQQENAALREEIDETSMFEEIVGTSSALQTVLSSISIVAPSDSTVLITGETGTGKELIARGIHRRSNRSSRPFITVNCAAIPRDLITQSCSVMRKGLSPAPHRNGLAVSNLPTVERSSWMKSVNSRPILRSPCSECCRSGNFGGGHSIRLNVRVIAATNRDLKTAVANGTFRQDLFYRLNVFPIAVPSLRERKEDILMLVEYFIQRYAAKAGKTIRSIDKKTLDVLQTYDWPGNIRELQNVIERSVILTFGDVLSVDELWLTHETSRPGTFTAVTEPRSEREIIEKALGETRGRVSGPSGAAAKL